MRRGEKGARVLDENSTTSALAAGASYTGQWYLTEGSISVTVATMTSAAGTLYIEQSPDAINTDSSLSYDIVANQNEIHRVTCTRKYVRVRMVNGSVAQSFLRLQTMIGYFEQLTSPLNLSTQRDADAIVTKAFNEEFLIRADIIEGMSIVNKFGYNPEVSTTTTPEDMWGGDGIYAGFNPTAAEPLRVVSSSAADAAAGTGLRTITVIGLDANYNIISETITLNGTTPVVSTQSFIRAHTAFGATAGSGGVNAGAIAISQNITTANVFLIMAVGRNQTNNAGYTVPAGYSAILKTLHASIRSNTATAADGSIWFRAFNSVFRSRRPFTVTTNYRLLDAIYGGLVFTEKTDIMIRIDTITSNNTPVSAGYDLILIKNN